VSSKMILTRTYPKSSRPWTQCWVN
ncbi:uncharacterized protein METZ01_LOCUS145928, partial [marine metagenome]